MYHYRVISSSSFLILLDVLRYYVLKQYVRTLLLTAQATLGHKQPVPKTMPGWLDIKLLKGQYLKPAVLLLSLDSSILNQQLHEVSKWSSKQEDCLHLSPECVWL